jgi:hypothetical protein
MISQRIAETRIEGVAIISTVLLPPEMSYGNPYETMVFTSDDSLNFDKRTDTLTDAMLNHIDAIAHVVKETHGL